MTLKETLSKLTYEKREYFKYKFPDVRYDKSIAPKTEVQFLKLVNRKTMNSFLEWEKSPEFATLVALYLQSKMMNDIHEIYAVVKEKAKTGDDKAIGTFLKLNKEINNMVKASSHITNDEEDVDDGLEM